MYQYYVILTIVVGLILLSTIVNFFLLIHIFNSMQDYLSYRITGRVTDKTRIATLRIKAMRDYMATRNTAQQNNKLRNEVITLLQNEWKV